MDKCSGNGGGDVHQGFQSLLSEVNKSGTQYLLRTANRLFGEKTFDILAVSIMYYREAISWLPSNNHIGLDTYTCTPPTYRHKPT